MARGISMLSFPNMEALSRPRHLQCLYEGIQETTLENHTDHQKVLIEIILGKVITLCPDLKQRVAGTGGG